MCGVVGIATSANNAQAAAEVARGLMALQHRGQDAAGLLSFDHSEQKFHQVKDRGLVSQVLDAPARKMPGQLAIGHTRYTTVGNSHSRDFQPLVSDEGIPVGMVHNGNLVNYTSLAKEVLHRRERPLQTGNDLELLLHLWCRKLDKTPTIKNCLQAAQNILTKARGAYSLVGILPSIGLFALRDPAGIRPLVLGRRERDNGRADYCVCSETGALRFLGYQYLREVAPGELLVIDQNGELFSHILTKNYNENRISAHNLGQIGGKQTGATEACSLHVARSDSAADPQDGLKCEYVETQRPAHCMFEWVYFAGAEGSIEKRSVYSARLNLGRLLARKIAPMIERGEIHPDVVCPVPDTGRTAAIALAEALQLPYREGLIKNRYVQRSFILKNQAERERAVELKLTPVESVVAGKNVLLADDSLVRGTTARQIIKLLKRYGAREVVLALSCPPIKFPCFYGIDFPFASHLVASQRTPSQIAEKVGADAVVYLDEADLPRAIGTTKLCSACLNGNYPVGAEHAEEFAHERRRHSNNPKPMESNL